MKIVENSVKCGDILEVKLYYLTADLIKNYKISLKNLSPRWGGGLRQEILYQRWGSWIKNLVAKASAWGMVISKLTFDQPLYQAESHGVIDHIQLLPNSRNIV